jgi:hypothetical protein
MNKGAKAPLCHAVHGMSAACPGRPDINI